MNILSIPLSEPERLFPHRNNLRSDYLTLLKTWHPDINKDPKAADIAAHIQALYSKAQEKHELGIWSAPGLLELTGTDGKIRTIRYRVKKTFELGEMYVSDSIVTFTIAKEFENLVLAGLRCIGTIRYPNESFRTSLEQYFPKVERYFETKDHFVICMRKQKNEILLTDLLDHLGSRIDPKHVAWILSCLFNLASFLSVTGLTLNGITPNTIFVNTPKHSLSLLGGWWYGAQTGKKLTTLPKEVHRLAPRRLLTDKTSDPALDLECIRAVGRACLGDITGSTFRLRNDIPKPMADFLMLPPNKNAVKDYEAWTKVLEDSFGKRKFIKLEVTGDHIYPKEAA